MNHRFAATLKHSAAAFLAMTLAAAPAMALPRSQQGARQPTASQGAAATLKDAEAQLKLANDAKARARLRVENALKATRPDWQAAVKEHDKAVLDVKSCATRKDCAVLAASPISLDAKGAYCADYKGSIPVGCIDALTPCLFINSWGASPSASADCFLFSSSCQPAGWTDCKSKDMMTSDKC